MKLSSSLAEVMRSCNAVTNYAEAVARWYFVYDPGSRTFRAPENLEELFQLVSALSLSGHIGRALNVTYKYPGLFRGEMGGDVQRVLGIGQLLRGNVDEAIAHLEAAVKTRKGKDNPRLALDQVGLARVHLIQGELDRASEEVEGAAKIVEAVDKTLVAPATLNVNYWHSVVRPAATGVVDFERATRVSANDKALHRRRLAQQLLRAREPEKAEAVAWSAFRQEHALPTQGIIFRHPVAPDADPFGWFLSYR